MSKALAAILSAAVLSFVTVAPAASQTKPAGQIDALQKVLLENANATVVAATYPPGAVLHTHGAARAVYVLRGPYHASWTMANGHTIIVNHKTGEAYWFPGGEVAVKNLGANTVRILAVIEKH